MDAQDPRKMAKTIFPESMLNKTSSDMTLESIAGKITSFSETLQLMHWQTMGYAEHKATNKAYDYLRDFMDILMERLMGYTGKRPNLYKIELLKCSSPDCVLQEVMSFAISLKSYGEENNYLDVCNLADELSGNCAKFKYLLTLS